MSGSAPTSETVRRLACYLILLGLFLTFRGYRSREVDQAYRLPILLHQQAPRLYQDDPFVRSFDRFNPHRGYLALLGLASQPAGLSVALAGLFGLTFLITVLGLDRLGSVVWSDQTRGTGLVAATLALIALAGNIGTNHLFEPILLDRLIAFGLGWCAIAWAIGNDRRGVAWSAMAVGLAGLVHPSVGLQLAMLLGTGWIVWRKCGVSFWTIVQAIALLALAIVPGWALNLRDSRLLLEGLPPTELRLLTAELQSPQHMLPHLWRFPQWLAWGCYPALALCACVPKSRDRKMPLARKRLLVLLGLNLFGLALAWFGIERMHHLRLTLFQPFRMATVARGLCLVLVAGHVRRLWQDEGETGRLRAVLIGLGLTGDWMMVVASAFEVTMSARDAVCSRGSCWWWRGQMAGFVVLVLGIAFLSRHDTESGHVLMLVAIVATLGLGRIVARGLRPLTPRRIAVRLAATWAIPLAVLGANLSAQDADVSDRSFRQALVRRCRFAEVPLDDLERLAVWCRRHTPEDARFIGPPGPKTFRLWSRRSLAFNRAGSPYHAAALADWSRRFRDHVGYQGTNADFVRAYLRNRHGLEHGYDALSADKKAALAIRQQAGYVVAAAPRGDTGDGGPLTLLHSEGRYAVYRVNRSARPGHRVVVSASPGTG